MGGSTNCALFILLSFLLLAQKKRNKEKGALSDEFFRQQGRKTKTETPRRFTPSLLLSELSDSILPIRVLAALASMFTATLF
ncbi:hypothetical protein DHD32_21590 [Arenibacter sp. TNZ]|nr:hypothetical protein [Arenibacter sp. TNZ]